MTFESIYVLYVAFYSGINKDKSLPKNIQKEFEKIFLIQRFKRYIA